MTKLSQGTCYPRLLQQKFSLQQERAADPGFFPSQSSSSEQQDHHSAEIVFLLCFFTDWAFFISVKKMLIILCTKWFLLRVQYATVVQPEGCDRFSISILGSLDMSFTLMFSSYLAMLSIFGSANAKCINMPPPNADKSYFLSWRLPVSSSGPGSSRRGKMYEN